MANYYNSPYYSKPIEVENIDWEILLIITDNLGRESIYSWYDVVEKNTESFYINKCLLWWFLKKIPESVLIIWFWGWAFAKYLEDHIEKIDITWIEIDKTMLEIARKEFKVKTNNLYISDALEALKTIIKQNKKYDLILIDVYWSDWEIPKYFWENTFAYKLSRILKIDWTISINYSNYKNNENGRLEKYNKIHSNFLKYFSKNYSFLIKWKKDNWNKVWIYNLDKKYSKSDFESNYLKNVELGKIKYDEKIFSDFKIKKTKLK